MTDLRKAAEMALDYIKDIRDHCACEGIECEKEDGLIEALRQALAQDEQEPTVPDNMQDWAKLDGVTAWHLMERHADNWADVGKMMNEFIEAKIKTAQPEQEPVAWHVETDDPDYSGMFFDKSSAFEHQSDHGGEITELYAAPVSKPEQEPVAWIRSGDDQLSLVKVEDDGYMVWKPLYTAPPSKPINFLVNGTRYKVTGLHDSGAIMGLPENLNGQWVALVDATDDKHLQYTAPPSKPWVSLTDEEMSDIYNKNYDDYVSENIGIVDFLMIAGAIEATLKEKNT